MAITYTPIATTTLGSAAASYTFSSISSAYTDLVLVCNAKNTDTASHRLDIVFNSDTGTNYSTTRLFGNGTTASSDRYSNATALDVGFLPGSLGTGFSPSIVNIQNYSNTTTYKTVIYRWGSQNAASGSQYTTAGVGLWRSTAAITSINITFYPSINIDAGSTFTLYGIKAA